MGKRNLLVFLVEDDGDTELVVELLVTSAILDLLYGDRTCS